MTSEELKQELESIRAEAQRIIDQKGPAHIAREYLGQAPLWEIAYQLAVLNESNVHKLDTPEVGKRRTVGECGEYPIAQFDDGSVVMLGSWTVGPYPGPWGAHELVFIDPDGNRTSRRYMNLEPGKRDAEVERGGIAELIESRVNLERCEADDRCDYDHVCRIHKIASLLKQQHSRGQF